MNNALDAAIREAMELTAAMVDKQVAGDWDALEKLGRHQADAVQALFLQDQAFSAEQRQRVEEISRLHKWLLQCVERDKHSVAAELRELMRGQNAVKAYTSK
jgi:flagellar protein FliT